MAGTGGASIRTDIDKKWIVCPRQNETATLQLVCFPSAGHGPSMFRPWATLLPPAVELLIVHLPGREARWNERPFVQVTEVVPRIGDALSLRLTRPFAFFGHSLGALLAFETARHLRRTDRVGPTHLFVSAHRAPQFPNRYPRIAHLSDAAFVAEVNARHGGVPEAVARNQELMDLMLPCLRADYQLFEDYAYAADRPLACPISVFGGAADQYVREQDLEGWRTQNTAGFTLRMLAGGHFFVNDGREAVVAHVLDDLQRKAN
jgi:surfactin synthase thioesterase subunit